MIPVASMRGRTVAVLGLGRTGRSVCRALAAGGARVWAFDDDPGRRAEAAAAGVEIVDLERCDWRALARLVLSPGVPLHHPRPHPLVQRAQEASVPVVGDVELMVENQPQRRVVGVTGTNGKSTTSALVAELLRASGQDVQLGGNIGLPVLDLLPKPEDDIYVLELSSFQLELTESLVCDAAVILNLSPDHLDRHGSMAGYIDAKRRILRNQRDSDWAVIGVDNDHGQDLMASLGQAHDRLVLPISGQRPLERGIYVEGGILYEALDREPRAVLDLKPLPALQGRHNWQNAAAAYGVMRALGGSCEAAAGGFDRFRGLPHRMEPVAIRGTVRFVNDSKATNAEAAARSLASFERIYWIAGGRAKEGGLEPLLGALGNVRHAFLIGEAAAPFARALQGHVPCAQSGDLARAVREAAAAADAAGGGVVLLAPACASFDQFASFEARGDAFKALVRRLVDVRDSAERGH